MKDNKTDIFIMCLATVFQVTLLTVAIIQDIAVELMLKGSAIFPPAFLGYMFIRPMLQSSGKKIYVSVFVIIMFSFYSIIGVVLVINATNINMQNFRDLSEIVLFIFTIVFLLYIFYLFAYASFRVSKPAINYAEKALVARTEKLVGGSSYAIEANDNNRNVLEYQNREHINRNSSISDRIKEVCRKDNIDYSLENSSIIAQKAGIKKNIIEDVIKSESNKDDSPIIDIRDVHRKVFAFYEKYDLDYISEKMVFHQLEELNIEVSLLKQYLKSNLINKYQVSNDIYFTYLEPLQFKNKFSAKEDVEIGVV